jgi:PTS system nitrogen regulatory IIA component
MNLSVRETAGLLKVSEKTIYRWIKQQSIPAYRVQDQYRFNRAEILEWATSRRLPVSSDIFEEPEAEGQSVPSLLGALEAGGVFYRVSGDDKESALREVVALLRLPPEVDRGFLLRVLLAREAIESTAVGDGIAIPHVRNPIVLHIDRPSISLCFLERPIEYGALDGAPVTTLFTIMSPTTRAHLHLMSKLSFILKDPGVQEAIRNQSPRMEIHREIERTEAGLASRERGAHLRTTGVAPAAGTTGSGEEATQQGIPIAVFTDPEEKSCD